MLGNGPGGEDAVTGFDRLKESVRLLQFYIPWYWTQWRSKLSLSRSEFRHPRVRAQLTFVERASRRLARTTLYAMTIHRQALQDDQGRQNRIEAVGEDLLVIAATAIYAEQQERNGHSEVWELTEEMFQSAKERIHKNMHELIRNRDGVGTAIGKRAVSGSYPSLSDGIIRRGLQDYAYSQRNSGSESEREAVGAVHDH